MTGEYFQQRRKTVKMLRVGLTKDENAQLQRLCRVSGFPASDQLELILPTALEHALNEGAFLAAEQEKGGVKTERHAGGRPAKVQAVGKE